MILFSPYEIQNYLDTPIQIAHLFNSRRLFSEGERAPSGCHTFQATRARSTTKLYDRTKERLTQDEVEWIRL